MTKQTEALKLALGYMDGRLVTDHLTGYERKRHVMEAIREALAEESSGTEQPQQENQMPKPTRDIPPEPKHLFAKTPSQPAQPQQEPVAWRVFDKDPFDGRDHRWVYFDKSEFVDGIDPTTHFNLEPVYTSPPAQRKPLTDEQIEDIWNRYCDEMGEASVNDALDIARAIEAAHGIKGDA